MRLDAVTLTLWPLNARIRSKTKFCQIQFHAHRLAVSIFCIFCNFYNFCKLSQ